MAVLGSQHYSLLIQCQEVIGNKYKKKYNELKKLLEDIDNFGINENEF